MYNQLCQSINIKVHANPSWDLLAVDMVKENEYILFSNLVQDNETVKFSDLAKYCITNPWKPIISIKDNTLEINDVFSSLIQSSLCPIMCEIDLFIFFKLLVPVKTASPRFFLSEFFKSLTSAA